MRLRRRGTVRLELASGAPGVALNAVGSIDPIQYLWMMVTGHLRGRLTARDPHQSLAPCDKSGESIAVDLVDAHVAEEARAASKQESAGTPKRRQVGTSPGECSQLELVA